MKERVTTVVRQIVADHPAGITLPEVAAASYGIIPPEQAIRAFRRNRDAICRSQLQRGRRKTDTFRPLSFAELERRGRRVLVSKALWWLRAAGMVTRDEAQRYFFCRGPLMASGPRPTTHVSFTAAERD